MLLCILITISWWFLYAHALLEWLCQLSLTSKHIYSSCTDILYQIWIFSHYPCKVMLPKTLISTEAMPCTASASHVYALGLPQGPIYLPVGYTLSILVNTNNNGDAHDAWGFSLPCTLHCHSTDIGFSKEILAMVSFEQCHIEYGIVLSSLVAALTWQHCIQSSIVP